MKDLLKLANECLSELDALGVEYGNIVEFTINTRAKSRWGQCCKRGNKYYININVDLLQDYVDDMSAKNTIMHEIIHTCENCMCHTNEWARIAELVNDCYSCYNIKRCTSAEEKGIKTEKIERTYKYNFKCDVCGQVIRRTRMSEFVKHPNRYRCAICHKGKFIEI